MIRKAQMIDLDQIFDLYVIARQFMIQTGNPYQWKDGYPEKKLLAKDIQCQQLYVYETNQIHGVFALIIGEDPTYAYIEQGQWLDDSPYGTIHRIASDGTIHGFFEQVINFASNKIAHLRIDTHADNAIMQHVIGKNQFQYCGIIYVRDHQPRLAYERI